MRELLSLTLLLWFLEVLVALTPHMNRTAHEIVHRRVELLKSLAISSAPANHICSSTQAVVYNPNYAYGNTGNIIIEFIHGLWVAKHNNATLVIPSWMSDSLKHFDLKVLSQAHCFTMTTPKDARILSISAEDAFWAVNWYQTHKNQVVNLPNYSARTVPDVSKLFLQVYAGLWSSPHKHIYSSALWVLEERLLSDFRFVAAHKRLMEGYCQDQMSWQNPVGDFSAEEIAMDSPEWSADLKKLHPLCQLSYDFVNRTMAIHGRADRPLFVAWDGQGSVTDYQMHKAVFSGGAETKHTGGGASSKYVDMFIAMQAEFFLLNPLSTFSFQILAVRLLLGMPITTNVPRMQKRDVYMRWLTDEKLLPWVSINSLEKAYQELKELLPPIASAEA